MTTTTTTARIFLDCGNTCVKWARCDVLAEWSLDMPMAVVADEDVLSVIPVGAEVYVCAVHGQRLARIEACFTQLSAPHIACFQVLGRDIALPHCGQHASCGADRITAGIAAVQHQRRQQSQPQQDGRVVVIDAGTMLTVTAWNYDVQSAYECSFMGGVIAPSPQACLDGMHAAAPALPAVAFDYEQVVVAAQGRTPLLVHDTVDQMQSAVRCTWQAGIRALIATACAERPDASVYVTGGNRNLLPLCPETAAAPSVRSLGLLGLAHIVLSQ